MEESNQLDVTLQQSVTKLTETNQILNDKVLELNEKIDNLEKDLETKDSIIKKYENEDYKNLKKTALLFIEKNYEEMKIVFESINRENLDEENQKIYDFILSKLN